MSVCAFIQFMSIQLYTTSVYDLTEEGNAIDETEITFYLYLI